MADTSRSASSRSSIELTSADGAIEVSIDLTSVQMTERQAAIVQKLFRQHPEPEIVEDTHSSAAERGMEGPGLAYLERDEFEEIRELGARLGTGPLAAGPIIDFCLHVINVGALEDWQAGFEVHQ